jgi:Recombination endonuclease VII
MSKGFPLSLTKIGADYYKICSCCRDLLHLDLFTKSKNKPLGLSVLCRKCTREKSKELYWKKGGYNRTYEQNKSHHLKKSYGITLDQYEEMKEEQHGLCAICSAELREGKGGAALDHNHSTGGIRGILCSPCNKGLGHFRDRTELLIKASIYLNKENNI